MGALTQYEVLTGVSNVAWLVVAPGIQRFRVGTRHVAELSDRVAQLERRLGRGSSNSSRPP